MAFIVQSRYTNLLRALREAENRAWDSTNLSKGKIYFFLSSPPQPQSLIFEEEPKPLRIPRENHIGCCSSPPTFSFLFFFFLQVKSGKNEKDSMPEEKQQWTQEDAGEDFEGGGQFFTLPGGWIISQTILEFKTYFHLVFFTLCL